jgi:UPF0716 protein FxsA
MLRRQGLAIVRKMQREQGTGFIGPQLLLDDMAIVSSGLLLMVPGLITDTLALLCLVGPLRRRVLALFGVNPVAGTTHRRFDSVTPDRQQSGTGRPASGRPASGRPASGRPAVGDTLEGEFRRLDD